MSHTFSLQKSRELLKEQGYATWITEKPYNPYTKRREDLFHCIDLVGIREDMPGIVGIQATGEDCQNHIRKILEGYEDAKGRKIGSNPYLPIWLKAGNRFFIWSWVLRGAKGKRKMYKLREVEFVLKDGIVTPQENPQVDG